eukprot:TCONS_00070970-protein
MSSSLCSVLFLCLAVCYFADVSMSRAVNCASKRWHSSIGCQEVKELKSIKREVHSREKLNRLLLKYLRSSMRSLRFGGPRGTKRADKQKKNGKVVVVDDLK